MSAAEPGAPEADVPLTFAQQRLWALDQLAPGLTAYNQISAHRIRGLLHPAALRWALDQLVRRHDGLRACFPSERGEPRQRILPALAVALTTLDLAGMSQASRDRQARELLTDALARPFDLTTGPLIRVDLLRLGERDHILAVIYHHIVCDGWSLGIFFEELIALYTARLDNRGNPLAPLPMTYGDYVTRERGRPGQPDQVNALAWWCDLLRDAPAVMELPTDRPRPAIQSYAGAHHHLFVRGLRWADLVAAARLRRMTPFMVGLSAYAALVSRLTGTTDVMIGTPAANRLTSAVEPLIGDFANNLPLRVDVSGDPTAEELLRRVRNLTLECFARQEVPFGQLVEKLRPPRSLSHTPVVQTLFVLHSVELFPALPGASVEVFRIEQQTNTMDLIVECAPYGEQVRLSVRYATALFDAATSARLGEQYGRFLTSIIREPETRISRLPLLSEAERRTTLVRWSVRGAAYPMTKFVHDHIERTARENPAAIAAICGRECLTYGDLDTRSGQLAAELRAQGVGPETIVGIRLVRGLPFIVAVLAVLRSGGAFLPLDPSLPDTRMRHILRIAGARHVVTSDGRILSDCGAAAWADSTVADGGSRGQEAAPGNLMYVIFTSGSSGEPKAVGIPHTGGANYMAWMQDLYPLTTDDRVLLKTPTSFDVSVFELLWPLMAGATLIVVAGEGHRDPAHLLDLIVAHRVTVAHFVPPMLAAFLDRPEVGRAASLRLLFASGQALPPDLAARCLAALPGVRLDNQYGPTECSINVTWWRCLANEKQLEVPIGRPIPGVFAYVLDSELQPVPVGVHGELYIGGVALARGYLSRADLTADRFVPDPFGRDGSRLYRTGDRVRWRPDGSLDYLGRLDDQVKLRGYRIEPGEIETALAEHPAVRQAIVRLHRTSSGDDQLAAYFVAAADVREMPTAGDLRDYLLTRLPAYLVPTHFVEIGQIPVTRNGKYDRSALPVPSVRGTETSAGRPVARTERVIAAIWQELLGASDIGVNDNFFDLGGHSLLVATARIRLLEALGRDVPMLTLYEHPTVAALARRLDSALAADAPVGLGDAATRIDGARDGASELRVEAWQRGRQQMIRQRQLLDQHQSETRRKE